jgi:hypothetical protein
LLAGGRLGLQLRLGLPQPCQPAGLGGQRGGQLVAAGVAVLEVVALSASAAWRRISATSRSSFSWVRLAFSAALPASLVPSSATVPTRTIPAAAHSRKDSTRNPARACSWRMRKRAMVTWSGVWLAASTRKATSSTQRRSIWREERTPMA